MSARGFVAGLALSVSSCAGPSNLAAVPEPRGAASRPTATAPRPATPARDPARVPAPATPVASGASAASVPDAPTPEPEAREREVPFATVRVQARDLLLDGRKICALPSSSEQARVGTGAACKSDRPLDLRMPPLIAALAAKEPTRAPGGLVRVELERTTPYRTMLDIMFSLGQAEFGGNELVVPATAPGRSLTARSYAPDFASLQASGGSTPDYLNVKIRREGVALFLVKEPIGSDCQVSSATVVQDNLFREPARLGECLRKVRARVDSTAYILADGNTEAATIVQVIGLLYCGTESCLESESQLRSRIFSNVNFKVTR